MAPYCSNTITKVTKEGIIDLCDDLEGSEAGAAEHDESPSKKQKCHKVILYYYVVDLVNGYVLVRVDERGRC